MTFFEHGPHAYGEVMGSSHAAKPADSSFARDLQEAGDGAEFYRRRVFFDIDGTLLDTDAFRREAQSRWLDNCGVHLGVDGAAPDGVAIEAIFSMYQPHRDIADCLREFQQVEDDLERERPIRALSGAREILNKLREDQWAAVTSNYAFRARRRLKEAGLPLPVLMVGAEDVAERKPSPQPYLLAMRLASSTPATSLAIEDSLVGALAAHRAGLAGWTVNTREPVGVEQRHFRTLRLAAPAVLDFVNSPQRFG